jgi:hypothetical protein
MSREAVSALLGTSEASIAARAQLQHIAATALVYPNSINRSPSDRFATMRSALLQSLPRSFVTQLTGLVHEPACAASATGTRHVVQQARSLADAQPEHRAAKDDHATAEV